MTWENILKTKTLSDADGNYKVSDVYSPSQFGDIVHSNLDEYHNQRRFNDITYDGGHPHVGGAHQYFKPNGEYIKSAVCMRCMVRINPQ